MMSKNSIRTPEIASSNRKWLIEKVVIPLIVAVIGGGGIVAIVVSFIEHPKQQQETSRPEDSKIRKEKESQLFFASSRYAAHSEKELSIHVGDDVSLHWDAPNETYPRLGIHIITISGHESWSDPLNPYGAMTVAPTETTDYYLLDRDGPFKAATLATLRVTVVP